MNSLRWPSNLERRDLLFARAYYFCYLGGWGFILPFLNLFYVSLGLSGAQIGLFGSVSALVSLVVAPVWVSQVRRQPQPRRYLQLALFLGAVGYQLIGRQTSFVPILLIVFLQTFATSGIPPMSDSLAVAVAQSSGSGYGTIRVWASVGWIATVLFSGWLIERWGFQASFMGVSLAFLIGVILLFSIRPQHFSDPLQGERPRASLLSAIRRVLQDRTLVGVALALVAIGFLNSGVVQFENVFLAQLGASKSLISVAGVLSALVEIPCMVWADRLMRRHGAHRLLLVALAMIMLLRIAVFLLPAIGTILGTRLVGGISFSLYTIAFVGLISQRTPAAETGTVLALFAATLGGLVNIVASPAAGVLFDILGGRWLYVLAMAGYGLGFTSLWLTRPRPVAAPAVL